VSYPAYAETKPSGVEWLGDVPARWEVKRLKHCVVDFVAGGTPDSNDKDFWDDEGGTAWVTIADMTRAYVIQSTTKRLTQEGLDAKHLQVLPAGTILYSMYASLGKVAFLGIPATTNQAILGIVPHEGVADRRLLRWWLESMEKHVSQLSSSNTQDNLNAEKVRNLPIFLPPLSEQQQIAAFLDRKTAELDAVLRLKERQLGLLAEKRQALISQAVTRGLDPTAPLKPSGIPWLGDVPGHWEVVPLKYLAKIKYGLGQPPSAMDDGLPLLRATNVERGKINPKGLMFIDPNDVPYDRDPVLRTNDIIVVRSGAYTGDSAIVTAEYEGAIAGYDMVVRAKTANPFFLAYGLLSTPILNNQIDLLRMRAAQPHLNAEELGECLFFIPPMPEQAGIVAYLDRETARMDGIAQAIRAQIGKVREYRQALISAAVTGKIDVRGQEKASSSACQD